MDCSKFFLNETAELDHVLFCPSCPFFLFCLHDVRLRCPSINCPLPVLLSIAKSPNMASIQRQMASVIDLRRQVDAIDRQVVELLSRRNVFVKQITTQLGEDEPDKAREAQVLSNWLEEGFDFEMDEVQLEKVCKSVMEMGRKAKDI